MDDIDSHTNQQEKRNRYNGTPRPACKNVKHIHQHKNDPDELRRFRSQRFASDIEFILIDKTQYGAAQKGKQRPSYHEVIHDTQIVIIHKWIGISHRHQEISAGRRKYDDIKPLYPLKKFQFPSGGGNIPPYDQCRDAKYYIISHDFQHISTAPRFCKSHHQKSQNCRCSDCYISDPHLPGLPVIKAHQNRQTEICPIY